VTDVLVRFSSCISSYIHHYCCEPLIGASATVRGSILLGWQFCSPFIMGRYVHRLPLGYCPDPSFTEGHRSIRRKICFVADIHPCTFLLGFCCCSAARPSVRDSGLRMPPPLQTAPFMARSVWSIYWTEIREHIPYFTILILILESQHR
jgi:hypothetical protein